MLIAADTHVHLYPFYDLALQFASAHRQLSAAAPGADLLLLCLTERAGQTGYEALRSGAQTIPGWRVDPADEPETLWISHPDGRRLAVLAGRQIITRERLEVLALGRNLRLDDGAPLDAVLARVREGGATPVLPWGLGKWFGARGRLIRNVLDTRTPDDVVFADTCLRPSWFPTPAHLRTARSRGFSILYGSDPLPRPHEETLTGQWATLWEADGDASHPAAVWRRIIRDRVSARPAGRRCSMIEALKRLR
ncbi:MAG TPA: hypothetical protein PKE12_03835 [Kiritimatiellia bacterium]|nr:hypothetical protein [Kiritimatiellia bacterium]